MADKGRNFEEARPQSFRKSLDKDQYVLQSILHLKISLCSKTMCLGVGRLRMSFSVRVQFSMHKA